MGEEATPNADYALVVNPHPVSVFHDFACTHDPCLCPSLDVVAADREPLTFDDGQSPLAHTATGGEAAIPKVLGEQLPFLVGDFDGAEVDLHTENIPATSGVRTPAHIDGSGAAPVQEKNP